LKGTSKLNSRRFLYFGAWVLVAAALFVKPFSALIALSLSNDNTSHIVLIPFISAWLLYFEEKRIFQQVSTDYLATAIFLLCGVAITVWTLLSSAIWSTTNVLSGYMLGLTLVWAAGFALFFGRQALLNARFPLLFLLLMVPLPDALLDRSIYLLQKGSADIAELIFDLAGVPALRDGFVFHLAHLSIEVAKECSGIRSSLALLILALLVGHLFLKTLWKQTLFVLVGLVIMVVKNGIRIATLTILAQYVDRSFLFGRLHHEGGVFFFLVGLLLLLPVFWVLRRGEKTAPAVVASS
jgi:exosortase